MTLELAATGTARKPLPRTAVTVARSAAGRILPPSAVLALAAWLRFRDLTSVGFNSDEAVYTGSAQALAGHTGLESMFPVFRAHPILVQLVIAQALRISDSDWSARAVTAGFGVAAVGLTYLLGRRLYGPAGCAAAGLLAVMPYHVTVSREVLLDGPMTCFGVLCLYCLARATADAPRRWAMAAGAALGLAALCKETSAVWVGSVFVFGAMGSAGRLKARHLLPGLAVFTGVFVAYPLAVRMAGASGTSQNFLLWQLLRRANHPLWFYFTALPGSVGVAVLVLALLGLVIRRRLLGWRERLLLAWIAVPVVFFTLWPVKGYQYLLPTAPALAVLAAIPVAALWDAREWPRTRRGPAAPNPALRRAARCAAPALALAAMATLLVPTWRQINPSDSTGFLAGTGGLPGGREAGRWIAVHLPRGSRLLGGGPSIANVLEYYSDREVGALSVSSDPRDRNPVYRPVPNPDLAVRRGEYQYLVWDSYTAARTPYFASELEKLVNRYHGVAVYTGTVMVATKLGPAPVPVIVVYEVHP
ncbi:phospholipid carrier-dependent glycosyltransferase [Streptacidiphilus sp. PB12-B1b]|uniref:ArnT family glycosyltransferase n=1 Tax=Streptacidiphilus sp. PB12-B1b TaxID=2705012 RepID=UPI0015F9466A|nr:glycosyltransferase family 39 protein [Streptacidiphilus sp. PB12-B1b]QMU77341.1 phospholipid carrier-dependent glycosyltransferase [Streptacidiphilus sp. PB12-B1b]